MLRDKTGLALLLILLLAQSVAAIDPPSNFRRENLVAWCIVPFDSRERTPEERAAMVEGLGLKRVAYDWRDQHVSEFEQEVLAYRDHGIEFFAFWKGHPDAYAIFDKHGITPQIWRTVRAEGGLTLQEKLDNAIEALVPAAEETKKHGFTLGLYNHGGWGGLPDNMAAVCEALRAKGYDHVGIVYNLHHSHPTVHTFASDLKKMLPYLTCLNLNGMVNPVKHDVAKLENKIRPIGKGELDREILRDIIDSGYEGPIGILGHVNTRDVEEVLRENIEGLEKLLAELE